MLPGVGGWVVASVLDILALFFLIKENWFAPWSEIVFKKIDVWYIEWQRVTTSGTASDNEWQRVVQRMTTSGTTSDNEWQRVTISTNFFFSSKTGAYH